MALNMPQRNKIELITNIPTHMRDGTTLYGDLYKPAGEGKHPAILCRYIFRKENMARNWEIYNPSYYTKKGYAVFIQDVRGLGQSEGEFVRFSTDGADGYDTIEWMAEQSWCDGNVGMFGHYYSGFLQYTAAAERPPHLKCICPMQTGVTLNRNNDARGFLFASHIGWCLSRVLDRMNDGRYDEQTVARLRPQIEAYFADYPNQVKYRPLKEMPAAQFEEFPILRDYIKFIVDGYDNLDLIHEEGKDMDLSRISVPVFECTGWLDSAHNSALDQHLALIDHGYGKAKQSEVLIGPWDSGESMTVHDVDMSFGMKSSGMEIGIVARMINWFDRWLKEEETEEFSQSPITYFVMGKNEWRSSRQWPPAGMRYVDCYLHSSGSANTLFGDGRLSFNAPDRAETPDEYLYNPARLVPTRPMGKDTRKLEHREDILVYTSEALQEDTEMTGLVKAVLYISSSAPDTDFMVKILDVYPDGKALALSDGATRARYRNSWTPELLEPDKNYEIIVNVGYTSYQFARGHSIRIEITSSNFMKFDYNHNTGMRPGDDPDIQSAVNVVHHSKDAASKILLPLVSGKNSHEAE
jgi:uncharacterized protein